MPHEQLMELLNNLKRLIEKERNMVVMDGWSSLCKKKAEDNVDNAITILEEAVSG